MFFRRRRDNEEPEESTGPEISIDPFQGDPDARALSEALGARDWPRALAIMESPDPVRQQWMVHVASTKRDVVEFVDDLIKVAPDSAMLWTVKGEAYVAWAWDARGSGWAKDVPPSVWATVRDRLRQAENFMDEAVDRDPTFVPAHAGLIQLAMARSKSTDELLGHFQAAIAIDPLNVAAHRGALMGLTQKWGGSSDQMFAFARERSALAPDGHDLPVLIAEAHIEEWLIQGRDDDYFERPEVGEEVGPAALRSCLHPSYRHQHGLTARTLNSFAFPLSVADRFAEAKACYDRIGDTLVTRSPWSYRAFPVSESYNHWRTYVTDSIAYEEEQQNASLHH